MTRDDIELAEAECQRFLVRCKAAKDAMTFRSFNNNVGFWDVDTRATAALKRSSMDLTRALVAIRRPSS